MLKKRIISAVFIVLFTFLTGFYGGPWLCFGMMLVSLQALFELYRASGIERSTFAVISYLNTVAIYTFMFFNKEHMMIYLLMVSILLYMTIYVFKFPFKLHVEFFLDYFDYLV